MSEERIESAVMYAVKVIKTEKLIDKLVYESIESSIVWRNEDCIRAFMETDCIPFNADDIAFRKAEKQCGMTDLYGVMSNLKNQGRIKDARQVNIIR